MNTYFIGKEIRGRQGVIRMQAMLLAASTFSVCLRRIFLTEQPTNYSVFFIMLFPYNRWINDEKHVMPKF